MYGAVEHWLSGALVNVGDMIYDHKIGLPCTKAPMSRVEFRDSIPAYITCTQTVPYEICNTCTFTKLSETVVVYASVRKPGFAIIDLVTCTLEKERKESSIVAAAHFKAIGTIP